MGLHRVCSVRSTLRTLVAAGLIVFGHSVAHAQTLTATANPSSGGAGVSNSYVTGSGFPPGAITGAVAHFGPACAAPQTTSSPVTQVTAIASLRRFQFLIPASLAPGNYKVWVSGTAGSTAFNSLNTPSCSAITVTSVVRGTASLGDAIGGANVTITDANGNTVSGVTASDGTFALNSANLTSPYLVKIVTTTADGNFPAGTTLYSVSADANASTNINVNVLTDAMLRTFYSAEGINVDQAFASPTGANAPPSPVAVQGAANLFIPAIQLWTNNDGLTLTGETPANGALNLITTPYAAFPPGVTPPSGSLDLLLHQITSETLNGDGSVNALTINSGTVTQTVSPTTANDLMTLTTVTMDSANPGNGSSATFTALALTQQLQPVIQGLQASFDFFKNTVNAKGAALTGSDLLPIYSLSYLDNGKDRVTDSNQEASQIAGVTITTLQVAGIKSYDPVSGIAEVLSTIAGIQNGQTFTQTDTTNGLFFRNEGGTWLLYGNQQVGEFFATVSARTFQGGGNSAGTFVNAFSETPAGSVTNIIIAGPTNSPALHIWNGNNGSAALIQGAQDLSGGQVRDTFFLLSNNLGNTFQQVNNKVPPGSNFVFIVSTTSNGTPQYVQSTGAITTEGVPFTSFKGGAIPAHAGLAAVVNQTVNLTFTWPSTYSFANGGFGLFAQIFDGPANSTSSHYCQIHSNNVVLNPNHTGSGSIVFPANMSVCGLNSNPIQAVQIFLEFDGDNGEQSLGFLGNFPY